MKSFQDYLTESNEVGFVSQFRQSVVFVEGLPTVQLHEFVVFESAQSDAFSATGHVLAIDQEYAEVLLLSANSVPIGTRVARTGQTVAVGVDQALLGRMVNPLGIPFDGGSAISAKDTRMIMQEPPGLEPRAEIDTFLETGVSVVDVVLPLGRGQRELVIGDRKSGKTSFLLTAVATQAAAGAVCVYAGIGKRAHAMAQVKSFLAEHQVAGRVVVVASNSADPPGLIYLTPYTAMSIAEYFQLQGRDVLLVLDDLTTHAQFYRQVSLLSGRFPGRDSYPGDIFYIHSQLLERAGNFKTGSITCLPVAESLQGDLAGYIQTNLMSITDGHIFFDLELFNQGKRPAVNPFLSVTRVGLQTQAETIKLLGRELVRHMIQIRRMRQFVHFGAELTQEVQQMLELGDRFEQFYYRQFNTRLPVAVSAFIIALLWGGFGKRFSSAERQQHVVAIAKKYHEDAAFAKQVNTLCTTPASLTEVLEQAVLMYNPPQGQAQENSKSQVPNDK